MAQATCPKCSSNNITFQREQTGSIGAGTNKVTIQTSKGHSCLYWFYQVPDNQRSGSRICKADQL